MRYLPPPTDDNSQALEAGDVYSTCVSMVKDRTLQAQLLALRQDIEAKSNDYTRKGAAKQLYLIQPHDQVGTVSGDEIVSVYTGRMVPKTSKGRKIYDRIMAGPLHGRCPLCGVGTVNTLDHFLPKKQFPAFSVTPVNLVPSCTWCQGSKWEYFATTKARQLLHPYFDNLENEVWLAAEVVRDVPASFRFFASPPDTWSRSAQARVREHLKQLDLPKLFTSNAGSRLSEIRGNLRTLHQKGGSQAVRAYLREARASAEAEHLNSWASAMYRAAASNKWFCNGGFLPT